MNIIAVFFFRIMFLSLLVVPYSILQGQNYKIVPIGNSITESNQSQYSYRYYLWEKLLADGFDMNFVGSEDQNYNGNPDWPEYKGLKFDSSHEGHSGLHADQLAKHLKRWMQSYTPDIALIHAGTNDIINGDRSVENINETIENLKNIIRVLREVNPEVIIFLAQLIPINSKADAAIVELNRKIPDIRTKMSVVNSPIIIVDQYTGFNKATDLRADGVHPTDVGERKIAQRWREAIRSFLLP